MVKLSSTLSQLCPAKVVVFGDLFLDTYTLGKAKRISPEAPVAIVSVEREDSLPGGAGNTALNLKSLGADVVLCGRVGRDYAGEQLKQVLKREGISTDWLVVQEHYFTPIKNRVIAENQQIVRIDHEKIVGLDEYLEQTLIDSLPKVLADASVVALSDYGKGFLSNDFLRQLFSFCRRNGIPVITDPKGQDFSKYLGTTVIKPNLSEAYAASGLGAEATLEQVAQKLLEKTCAEMLMITRSEAGLSLFYPNGLRRDFPVHVKEVKDVTGAGDTVLATLTFAMANRVTDEEAAELCNTAASIAIEHIGCARVSLIDLSHRLLQKNSDEKVFDEDHLFVLSQVLRTRPSTFLIVPKLEAFSISLYQSIKSLSRKGEIEALFIVYIIDPSPSQAVLELLTSFEEVSFILVHSQETQQAFCSLDPDECYLYANETVSKLPLFSAYFKESTFTW